MILDRKVPLARLLSIVIVAILFIEMLFFPVAAKAAEQELNDEQSELLNLVPNSSFEEVTGGMPTGWVRWVASGTPGAVASVDESVYKDGAKSFKMIGESTSTRTAYGRSIGGIKENTTYDFSGWVRTEGVIGKASNSRSATIRIQFIDAANVYTGPVFVGSLKGTQDWTLVSQQITTPPGTVKILLQCFIWEASGTVWFDNLVLTENVGTNPPEDEEVDLPQAGEIVAALKAKHPNKNHPRIMATASDFSRIRNQIANDPYVAQMFQKVKAEALNSLDQPLPEYVLPDGYRLLATSQRVLNEIRRLGMMAQLVDGEERAQYVDRAWALLQAAGSFPDWNPQHFLDVGEMTNAFAVAYDWMYDEWTEEQKAFIRNAIVTKGLEPALAAYRGEDSKAWWLNVRHNWNTVVNGGIGIGALAIADENEQLELLAGEVLEGGLRLIQLVLPTFEPDGGGEEGVGYWDYNARYFVYYVSSLESALGTDYGLSDATGVSGTPYFPIYLAGPNGSFNYGDNSTSIVRNPIYFWFANRFNNPDLGWYQRSQLDNGTPPGELDLLWYNPDNVSDSNHVSLDLDQLYQGIDAGSMRNAWNDPYATFVGFKGGSNTYNHSHLDLGTFVIDALGERWANDLGLDNYNLPGYFSSTGRSNYYRLRTEGHNTLVLNPTYEDGQIANARANIIGTGFSAQQAYMITDLSAAYATQAAQVKRGMALIDHRRQIVLQDEVKMKAPGDFFWFMHTSAQIEITDAGKSALLTSGDKKMWAHILTTDADVSFEIRDSEPLPTSPNPSGQAVNVNPKLTIRGSEIDELRLSVLFVPLMAWEEIPEQLPEVTPLEQWDIPDSDAAALSHIKVNGDLLQGFRKDTFTYHMELSEGAVIPVVEAYSEQAGDTVSVVYPDSLPGLVSIRVQPGDNTTMASEYRLYLNVPDDSDAIVKASADDGNEPKNTLDKNLDTRWSAQGLGQWIQYKLDSEREINHVDIAFYSGDKRSTLFDILVSSDGEEWTKVYSGQSSGTTTRLESFSFQEVSAQYVRIVGYGNTLNLWNSLAEVEIDGLPELVLPDRLGSVTAELDNRIMLVGENAQLNVQAFMQSGANLDWSLASRRYFTLNPAIAQIDQQGVVQGIGYGSTKVGVDVNLGGYTKTAVTEVVVDDGAIYIVPTADSFVQGGLSVGNNYGSNKTLLAKNDAGQNNTRESFMQFDLSSVQNQIVSAKLYVNAAVQDSGGTEATLALYEVLSDWNESEITWNTRPERGAFLNSIQIDSTFQWREIDLTTYVQDQYARGEKLNLAFLQNMDGKGLAIQIRSREHDLKPYLKIMTEPAAPPVTTASLLPSEPNGRNGWYTDAVTLALEVEDTSGGAVSTELRIGDEEGWQPYVQPISFEDGEHIVQFRSRNDKEGQEEAHELQFAVDTIAPVVTLAVYGSYASSDFVVPAAWIKMTDTMSGLDDSAMSVMLDGVVLQPEQTVPLYTLALGTHQLTVTGVDLAGNEAVAIAEFTVESSMAALQALVAEFQVQGRIDNDGIANSLQAKLNAGDLNSFVFELNAQAGKHITTEAASILIRNAQYLME
jgi:hypothetical protein